MDVCLNTYGSLDSYVKLLNDNGIEPDSFPESNQAVQWDNTLVVNQTIRTVTVKKNITYSTAQPPATIINYNLLTEGGASILTEGGAKLEKEH